MPLQKGAKARQIPPFLRSAGQIHQEPDEAVSNRWPEEGERSNH